MSDHGKKWISDLFELHRKERDAQNARDAVKLNEDRAFRNLLPAWTDTLKGDIRDLVENLNTQLAADHRLHAVQIHETTNGCELFTAEMPLYVINVNPDAHAIEFGYKGERPKKMRLVLRDNAIVGEPDGPFGGGEAEYAISDYLVPAIKKIT